jgi:hypothetical protein
MPEYPEDISATRLSRRDPEGFPPHPRGWLSIVVICALLMSKGLSRRVLGLQACFELLLLQAFKFCA